MTNDKMTFKQAIQHDCIRFANSFNRMEAVFGLIGQMTHRQWLKLLGSQWATCDNIAAFSNEIYEALERLDLPVLEMMTATERRAHQNLGDGITVYRGCGSHNINGWSWTTDRQTAERFPFLNRYQIAEPLLVTGWVSKGDVIAVKLDRGEQEIIVCPSCVEIESINTDLNPR